MSKTVLLIESDPKFARDMSAALESKGFGVRTSSDGKEGVELARALRPDCVVLCVELPGLSGYSWCNRLKKDDALKAIPLVITSSEATPETFEQHRKLKTRAEDYLIKPFLPATLVERVGALVGMPEASAADEEELITLADVELDGAAGGATANEEDADLKMLDDAFDNISGGGGDEPSTRAPGAPVSEPPLTLLPDADESPAILDLDREMAEALASLAAEASAPARVAPLAPPRPPRPVRLVEPTVESVAADDETSLLLEDVEVLPTIDVTAESAAVAEAAAAAAAAAAASAAALQASQAEVRALQEAARARSEEIDRLRSTSAGWENEVGSRNAELASTRTRLESVEESVRALASSLDTDREALRLSRDRSSELERELNALRPHLEASEKAASARGAEAIEAVDRAEGLERTVEEARAEAAAARADAETLRADGDTLRSEAETLRAEGVNLRAEVVHLRGEVEGLRAESANVRTEAEGFRAAAAAFRTQAEARAAELAQQLEESEAQVAQHEDRVLQAYQKIKSDEKIREKTRKALAMVIQVLEERSPGDGTAPPATPER